MRYMTILMRAAQQHARGSEAMVALATEALEAGQQLHERVMSGWALDWDCVLDWSAELCHALAWCCEALGDRTAASTHCWEEVHLWESHLQQLDKPSMQARTLHTQAMARAARVQGELGQHAQAQAALRQALEFAQQTHQHEGGSAAIQCLVHAVFVCNGAVVAGPWFWAATRFTT